MTNANDRTRAWLERTNPLIGLSVAHAQGIFDAARGTGSALLQRIYAEIESADPILMTCVERRAAALVGMGWRVTVRAEADQKLADEQRTAVAEFADSIDNLDETIEHLDGAFFRGFAHAQPIWEGPRVKHVNLLNSWNFLRDLEGRWYWNPDCRLDLAGLETVEGARLVTVTRPRAIDYPAMIIYIRKALGERDWGRFVERYGIPPVDAVMGPDATNENRAKYVETALAARDGDPAVWPNGTVVTRAEGSRGQDPFTGFIEHQQKLVVLMATGGTLTSLAEADTGSLAGGAQMDVWTQIVRRDAQLVGAALHRALFRPFLEASFPGRPVSATFELGMEEEASADETADLAVKLRSAGYTVDQAQLEEKTALKLEKATETPKQGPFGSLPITNKAATPLQTPENALQNASGNPGAQRAEKTADASEGVLGAFLKDTSKAAEAIKDLLADMKAGKDVKAAAAALVSDLPNLIPEDPALAAVIAEAMAAEFASTTSQPSHKSPPSQEPIANAGTSEGAKKGWETRRKNGWTPEQVAENKVKVAALAKKALTDRSSDDSVDMGTIEGAAAEDIKKLTGVDVTGYSQEITTHDIRHEDKRHGPPRKIGKKKYGERRDDQVPISEGDYERIPELLSDYDNIELGDPERNTGRASVVYTKKYPDGVQYGVEVVIEEDKKLHYKTGWKKKP